MHALPCQNQPFPCRYQPFGSQNQATTGVRTGGDFNPKACVSGSIRSENRVRTKPARHCFRFCGHHRLPSGPCRPCFPAAIRSPAFGRHSGPIAPVRGQGRTRSRPSGGRDWKMIKKNTASAGPEIFSRCNKRLIISLFDTLSLCYFCMYMTSVRTWDLLVETI